VPKLAEKRVDLVTAAGSWQVTPCLGGAYDVLFFGPTTDERYKHLWRITDQLPNAHAETGKTQSFRVPTM